MAYICRIFIHISLHIYVVDQKYFYILTFLLYSEMFTFLGSLCPI
jgi:hypothetical protein